MPRRDLVLRTRRLFTRNAWIALAAMMAVGVTFSANQALAGEAPLAAKAKGGAPELVQAALDAELANDAVGRAKLLAQAIQTDPEYGPARWHSAQVKFDGHWRTPDDVQQMATYHRRWTEYRELRDSLGDSPGDHANLAAWCRDNGLANEERYHWASVLLASPGDATALDRLGLVEHQGALLPKEQVARLDDQAKAAKRNFARHKAHFVQLCREATQRDFVRRHAALDEIRHVADLAALDALEYAVDRASARAADFALDLQLAQIAALANIPQYEATLRLLSHAMWAPLPEVRREAAVSLKRRPQTDYVPLLMAALTAPLEVDVGLFAAPDGTVRLTETVFQAGAEIDASHVRSINFETDGALRYDPSRNNPGAVLSAHLGSAAAIAADTQQRVAVANDEAAARNQRIEEILAVAADFDPAADAEAWWIAWQDYNELQYTSQDQANETYEEYVQEYEYAQGSPLPTISGDMRGSFAVAPICSCFRAGTLVWTQSGPTPIEQIAVGDMALAQNPETGELAYRPVLATLIGRPTRVLRLELPDETIVTTLGHRFWVNGRGWEMAKFLKPATPLHAADGPVEVLSIAEDEPIECYNLIVDEFHCYFVGKTRILVHDIGCPRPVIAGVPGSATPRTSLPSDRAAEVAMAGK